MVAFGSRSVDRARRAWKMAGSRVGGIPARASASRNGEVRSPIPQPGARHTVRGHHRGTALLPCAVNDFTVPPKATHPTNTLTIRRRCVMQSLRTMIIVVGTALALAWQPGAANAQTTAGSPAAASVASTQKQSNLRPIAIGLGAIAGVIVFNVAALGVEALPGGFAYGAGAVVPAEMSVAMSRVYATTAAVIGGWVAYYSYGR
jgi:hypothetical protein